MSLDLILLALVLLFAALGAVTGAARQIASLVGSVAAYLCARPLGNQAGPAIAGSLHVPVLLGTLAGTLVAFIAVLLLVRTVLTRLLTRILAGKDQDSANLNILFGFLFGGAKVAVIAWVMLSALAFVEENVSVAGRHLNMEPGDSRAFTLAKQHNLFALAQFSAVKNLAHLAQAVRDPVRAQQLRQDPAFQALMKDPRFREAIKTRGVSGPGSSGSPGSEDDAGTYGLLLRNNDVFQLIQDRLATARMEAASESIEGIPASRSAAGPTPPHHPR